MKNMGQELWVESDREHALHVVHIPRNSVTSFCISGKKKNLYRILKFKQMVSVKVVSWKLWRCVESSHRRRLASITAYTHHCMMEKVQNRDSVERVTFNDC